MSKLTPLQEQYRQEFMDSLKPLLDYMRDCPDCGVKPGELHWPSCDVDHCRNCGGQLLGSCCDDMKGPNVWTGIWPGELECAMYGVDLNSLFTPSKFKWNKNLQTWRPV